MYEDTAVGPTYALSPNSTFTSTGHNLHLFLVYVHTSFSPQVGRVWLSLSGEALKLISINSQPSAWTISLSTGVQLFNPLPCRLISYRPYPHLTNPIRQGTQVKQKCLNIFEHLSQPTTSTSVPESSTTKNNSVVMSGKCSYYCSLNTCSNVHCLLILRTLTPIILAIACFASNFQQAYLG